MQTQIDALKLLINDGDTSGTVAEAMSSCQPAVDYVLEQELILDRVTHFEMTAGFLLLIATVVKSDPEFAETLCNWTAGVIGL